ncbi:carbohydrate ABC transporter permease [Galbitalea sp. SE-J8]|uniref:carbohydrate ABC transporter permease n=1 Tax=Galbitalea sp. SE-J8 TaxID=3054952 RepID=UPI00259C90EB|nr:carbohydrate ABC transporter permease [Galbitalea sp. SE-J8]MDM4761551.1 carbohydrate ABC transporter permease [Galbitalea sp. SE-J8]
MSGVMSSSIPSVRSGVRRRARPDWFRAGLWVALLLALIVWSIPFLVMVFTSFKANADAAASAPWLPPSEWHVANYADAARTGRLATTAVNSLIVALVKVPIGLAVASAAAFALSRLPFRGSRVLLAVIVVGSMVPVQIALSPLFTEMLNLGLLNSLAGLVLPYLAFGIPYQIFILHGFFSAIPVELEEAARLDGASTFRIFWRICLPLAVPALGALFILDFVATWNEYAIAQTLLQSQSNWTIPLAVQGFSTQYSTNFGPLNAFIIMSVVPVLIVYLLFQRSFVSGAFAGAVKS